MQYWVLPEQRCHPIWRKDADGMSNVAPDALDLPGDLAARFSRWAQTFEAAFDASDPMAAGFVDQASEEEFYEVGRALAQELHQALPDATVAFFDDRPGIRRLVCMT